ncbi:MAG TPA: serine hydrolase domain-containing protein [Gemmatimonadaceae bacterium]
MTRLAALLALPLLGCAAPRSNPTPGGRSPRLTHDIDSILAPYASLDGPGASVVVIKGGRVVAERSYGLADVEARVPITDRADFRLASLTKQFTATAVMLLVKEGKLSLDKRVSDVLPELPAYARGITIRHLLTHTSGIWAYEDFVPDTQTYEVNDRDALALIARADSLYFPPGSAFRYSNTGYALLALIVERTSGERFADFLRNHIFRPLGMDSTLAYEQGVSTVPNRAYGYSAASAGGFTRTDQSNTSAVLGDGGVYTSIHDLIAWNRALDEHTLVDAAAQQLIWTPQTLAGDGQAPYGFGWWIARDDWGTRLWHNGETRGFTNGIVKYPDRGITVILLTNRTGGEPWELARAIAHLPSLAALP